MSEASEKAGRRMEAPREAHQPAGPHPLAGLVARFQRAGFQRADVAVLQPVDPFLELSGEDIRRRLFVTQTEAGAELCLRPEFTIPAALAYLQSGIIGRRADQVFAGPVFRHRPGETGEFTQVSLESIGRLDREAADADLLTETFNAVAEAIEHDPVISIGDLGLFSALLTTLALDASSSRKLALALGEGRLPALLDPQGIAERKAEARGLARYPAVIDALKGADPDEARAFVKDLISIAGISTIGGRSAEDIATRFLDRAREETQALGVEQAAILRRFLAIEGDPDSVAAELRLLAGEAGLDLEAAIDRFELRTGFLEARGVPVAAIQAGAGFSRSMDYYSGFVFDLRIGGAARPLASGGRYDRLFERLGHSVPATGAAIWIDRLGTEGSA